MKNNVSNSTKYQATPEELAILKKYKKRSWFNETWRGLRKNKGAILGLIIIAILILIVIFADMIYSYENIVIMPDYSIALQGPSSSHPLGTDEFGRDVLARILHGARLSLRIAIASTAISLSIGGIVGAYAGYIGGWFDTVLMRVMDIFLAVPNMLLALAIVAALGPNMFNLIIAIAISDIPRFARILRSSVLSIKETEFVEASKAAGAGTSTIVFREVIPNCLAQIIVQASIVMAYAIIIAASLSFIGLGVQPPAPEWGAMLSSGREYMRNHNYLVLFPGLAIVITVIAFNMLGDGLRDALDPRLKK
jgi:peptide/nickel transport system permease protein